MNILINLEVYRKMFGYIKAAKGEISGLAKVIRFPDDLSTFRIVDIALFEQVCTQASTDIQAESLAKFAVDMMEKKEDLGLWCCWWHSHAHMNTFWSNTDTNTIESLSPESITNNFIVSMVGNKKNELLCRIDSFDPIRATADKVEYFIDYGDDNLEEICAKEVEEKVVEPYVPEKKDSSQVSIITTPMTVGEIAAANEKKQMEEDEWYTIFELTGSNKKINYWLDETGIYIMQKDGKMHKKTTGFTKKELKKLNAAREAADMMRDAADKKFLDEHPESDPDTIIVDNWGNVKGYETRRYEFE